MNCLLCLHGADEITPANPKYEPHAFVCDDCAHDECLFSECENCGNEYPTFGLIQADDGNQTVYCGSCVPYRWSENDPPETGEEGWGKYADAAAKENLTITGNDLSSALSNMLKVTL